MWSRVSVPPVAVGGVGGSGTRLVAELLRRLGYYLGGDLNEATDNLWFTLLFKRAELGRADRSSQSFDRAVDIFRSVMADGLPLTDAQVAWVHGLAAQDRPQHDAAWLRARVDSLVRAAGRAPRWRQWLAKHFASLRRTGRSPRRWGWKEPNTHVFLDRLVVAFPEMKYVHVMRNGLDMAHSSNQSQLLFWGPSFLGTHDYSVSPRWSLKYWCAVHRRVLAVGETMPGRFLLLDYDRLCSSPHEGLDRLLRFLGERADDQRALENVVHAPSSKGRFRKFGLDVFDVEDVAYVKGLGFETRCD